MISEGSCDTEDCSNDAGFFFFFFLHKFTQKTTIVNCNNISKYYCFTVLCYQNFGNMVVELEECTQQIKII